MKNIFNNMFTITGVNSLLEKLDKFSHQIEEQDETINELQTELKYRKNENIRLAEENNKLQNDLQQTVNEVKLLNKQIDKLKTENNDLRLRHKMFKRTLLNSWYGSFCYTDTDSIKSESEDKE